VRVAQESNARAFFNVNLAQALEVPYVASTARLPTLHHIIVATQANLAELVNLPRAAMLLDQVYGEALPLSVRREGDVLQLPFFASAVLQRAFRPTEIPEVLAEVRDAVRPLRDRLFEIEEHVQSAGPAARRELQAMRAAFTESSPWEKILPSAELGAAIGHVVILWADPVLSLAGPAGLPGARARSCARLPARGSSRIVVSLLHTVIAVGTAETILGASRPHYRVVRRFGLDGNSADAAARLWSIDDQQAWTARVNRIASVAGSLA
jgi:hypothetical protein